MRYSGWNREEKARYLWLLHERERREKERFRRDIQDAKEERILTPEVVAKFAYLHFVDERGKPIWPAAHHWLWLRLICNTEIKRLWIIATPESAKTTWLLAYAACSIGFWPERPRLIACQTGSVAEKRSLSLRTLVESESYQKTFPNVLRAKGLGWTASEWSVAHGGLAYSGRLHPTLFAIGTGGAIIGTRAAEALGDDILDFENTRTPGQRKTVNDWLHNSFLSRVVARTGRVRMIGNAWHHDDAAARAKRSGAWVVCHIPLLSQSATVYANIFYPESYRGIRLGEPVGAEIE